MRFSIKKLSEKLVYYLDMFHQTLNSLIQLMMSMFVLFLCGIAVGTLGLVYRDKVERTVFLKIIQYVIKVETVAQLHSQLMLQIRNIAHT